MELALLTDLGKHSFSQERELTGNLVVHPVSSEDSAAVDAVTCSKISIRHQVSGSFFSVTVHPQERLAACSCVVNDQLRIPCAEVVKALHSLALPDDEIAIVIKNCFLPPYLCETYVRTFENLHVDIPTSDCLERQSSNAMSVLPPPYYKVRKVGRNKKRRMKSQGEMGSGGKTHRTGRRKRATKAAMNAATLIDIFSFSDPLPTSIDANHDDNANNNSRCCSKCGLPGCRADICETHRQSNFVPPSALVASRDYVVFKCAGAPTLDSCDEKAVFVTKKIQLHLQESDFVRDTLVSFGEDIHLFVANYSNEEPNSPAVFSAHGQEERVGQPKDEPTSPTSSWNMYDEAMQQAAADWDVDSQEISRNTSKCEQPPMVEFDVYPFAKHHLSIDASVFSKIKAIILDISYVPSPEETAKFAAMNEERGIIDLRKGEGSDTIAKFGTEPIT